MYFPQPYSTIIFNGFSVGLPKWFITSYGPYLKIAECYTALEKQRISILLKNRERDFEWFKNVTSGVREQINREKAPLIVDLYIKTVDFFEKKNWPIEYKAERDVSIYFCNGAIQTRCIDGKVNVSDNLASAIIHNPFTCQGGYVSVFGFVKKGLVRNAESADFLTSVLFNDIGEVGGCVKLVCEWIRCKWINPKKYINHITRFIGSSYIEYRSNRDGECRELLNAVKSVNISVYRKISQVFDSEIKRFNLQCFDRYKRDRDNYPKDFVAYPFADGTRMKPVRNLFSWHLK